MKLIRAALLIVLACSGAACGSPTSPSVPTAQGLWHGGWSADTCTGTGIYSANCFLDVGGFDLRLTQSDRALRGFIHVCGSEISDITGAVETDGTVSLSGHGDVPFNVPITLSLFRSTISGSSMTGSFACTIFLGESTMTMGGKLNDVTRFSPDPNAPF